MKIIVLLPLAFATSLASAAQPVCNTQTLDLYEAKMCVTTIPFKHDYYTLWVGGDQIFTLPDDYVEKVTLHHTVPEDAAIEFPLSRQGGKSVTISGGCLPISEKRESGGKSIGIEVGRTCSFIWGSVPIVKDLRFTFE